MSPSKKRDRLVFQAVDALNEEDAIAVTKRKASSKKQKQNSLASISQQSIHTKLLEVRILLQRAIQTQLVHPNQQSGENTEDAIQQCNHLLVKLLSARQALFPTDKNNDDQQEDVATVVEDDDSLEEKLDQDYKAHEKEWKDVLNQRHKDVRLHAGLTSKSQFRVLDSSFWEQVDQTVTHEKLVHQKNNKDSSKGTLAQFDDSKIYQQHLKEFLSTASDASQKKTAQQSSVERLNGTRKRTVNTVDRRASKGRKIRYTTIPKLVNFTFPLSRPSTSNMIDEDAWFRSLFGGAAGSAGSTYS